MVNGLLLTVLSVVSLYPVFYLLLWVRRRMKILRVFKDNGIPGPEPNFFTGNHHQLKDAPTPNDVITRWLKQYGNVFGYFIGESPHLVVNDIDLLKKVMIKDNKFFFNRPRVTVDVDPLPHSLLRLEGQRWKEVRSTLTPSFSSSKIKLMTSIMDQKTTTMVQLIKDKSVSNEMFDIYPVFQALTLDVIAHCALAMKVNCLGNPNDPFLLAVRNFFLHVQNKVLEIAVLFPFFARILTFVANFLKAGKMTTMIVNSMKEVISQRRNHTGFRRRDLLQMMLDEAENREGLVEDPSGKKKNVHLTDIEIIANAYVFLLGGFETTATALAFTFDLLVRHPEVQEKLYEEIKSKLTDDQWSYDSIHSLQYLDQVFNEALRLYPPVTGFVTRASSEEYRIGDVVVPKDVTLQAAVWDIHHDPKLWSDPWKFDPERFAPENKSNIKSMAFLAFGAGPRNCIGMRFAQLEAKLAIAKLVTKFRFLHCERTEDTLSLICPTVIINPANGVYLRAVLRDSSP